MKRLICGVLLAVVAASPAAAFQRGDWVLSQWQGDENYYAGVVDRVDGKSVTVRYDDGDTDTRPANQVKKYNWRVGSRVECNFQRGGTWYPGEISKLNNTKLSVAYDDGDRETTNTGLCRSK
ncbi:MAG: hypothetical protein H7Y08_01715 [Rhizobiaceae bacterium]|nr:hypothetical protein [Rhizobiaceae bacterium]